MKTNNKNKAIKCVMVNFGHVDVTLPLYNYLRQQELDLDLILCFSLDRKSESVIDFEDIVIETGFLSPNTVSRILPSAIKNYLQDISSIHFFIYHNLKLRSLKNLFLSIQLANILKNYDVIHFNGMNGVLPILIFLLKSKKVIFTVHDIYPHSGEKVSKFHLKMVDYLAKSKYPVIVQNTVDYDNLKKRYPKNHDKFHYIPFGVLEILRAYSAKNENCSDILLFGRISPYKGIDYLIDAIKLLKNRGLEVKTIIAGKGEIYFDTDCFDCLGIELINCYLDTDRLIGLIKNTKVVVCPYTDATQSGVLMTAFAFGKPVIASAVGGFKDVIIDNYNGLLVPPMDSDALAKAIQKMLFTKSLLSQLENNIEEFEANYSTFCWINIAKEFIEIYYREIGLMYNE